MINIAPQRFPRRIAIPSIAWRIAYENVPTSISSSCLRSTRASRPIAAWMSEFSGSRRSDRIASSRLALASARKSRKRPNPSASESTAVDQLVRGDDPEAERGAGRGV